MPQLRPAGAYPEDALMSLEPDPVAILTLQTLRLFLAIIDPEGYAMTTTFLT
jgi:hypothetical protein